MAPPTYSPASSSGALLAGEVKKSKSALSDSQQLFSTRSVKSQSVSNILKEANQAVAASAHKGESEEKLDTTTNTPILSDVEPTNIFAADPEQSYMYAQKSKELALNKERQEHNEVEKKTRQPTATTSTFIAKVKIGLEQPVKQHRKYMGIFPVSNRYLAQRWDENNHAKHLARLSKTKSTIDNSPPRNYMHLQLNLKKLRVEEGALKADFCF